MFGDDDEIRIRYVERHANSMERFSQMQGLSPTGDKNMGVRVDQRSALFRI